MDAKRRAAVRSQRNAVLLEPAGLPRAPAAPVLLDPRPHRNVDQPGIASEILALPDDVLIATLTSLGCPRWFAEQVRVHPTVRFQAVATWCLVQDAREGASVQNGLTGEWRKARDLVDEIREQYEQARKAEQISERPGHTIGLGDR